MANVQPPPYPGLSDEASFVAEIAWTLYDNWTGYIKRRATSTPLAFEYARLVKALGEIPSHLFADKGIEVEIIESTCMHLPQVDCTLKDHPVIRVSW